MLSTDTESNIVCMTSMVTSRSSWHIILIKFKIIQMIKTDQKMNNNWFVKTGTDGEFTYFFNMVLKDYKLSEIGSVVYTVLEDLKCFDRTTSKIETDNLYNIRRLTIATYTIPRTHKNPLRICVIIPHCESPTPMGLRRVKVFAQIYTKQ